MNIFEQFGIKEVADVTIYAIDLDKYDDEIYIPIMYLDTLKVSTIEQTASQTSARGGLGNAELVSWDFGKEISVSLQDALFTPASQSLMWGGRYGIRKPEIYGVWNPFIYPTNDRGEQIYIRKVEADLQELSSTVSIAKGLTSTVLNGTKRWKLVLAYINSNSSHDGAYEKEYIVGQDVKIGGDTFVLRDITFVNIPTTGNLGWQFTFADSTSMTISIGLNQDETDVDFSQGWPKLITSTGTLIGRLGPGLDYTKFICPCDDETKTYIYVSESGEYKYTELSSQNYSADQLISTIDQCPAGGDLYDSEEAIAPITKYTVAASGIKTSEAWYDSKRPEIASLRVDKFGQFSYDTFSLEHTVSEPNKCFYVSQDFCDNTLIKCSAEAVDAYGYEWQDTSVIMNSYEGEQDSYYLDAIDIRYRVRSADNKTEVGITYTNSGESYRPKIDIYKNIVQKYVDRTGITQELSMKVKIGTFYIIEDWNLSESTPQSLNNLIETGINNVDILETMDKLKATKTFAIDTDKNVRCSNYRYDPAYAQKALTVFINPRTMQPYEANASTYLTEDGVELIGNFAIIRQNETYYKWQRQISDGLSSLGHQIIVDAKHFPGTYRIVGETLARSRTDGQDQRYQFEIPICKLSAETNITLEAAGDPTTFSMNFKVLRKDDGTMMKLTQYGKPVNRVEEYNMPSWEDEEFQTRLGAFRATPLTKTFSVVNPSSITTQYTDADEDAPLDGSATGHVNVADQSFLDANTVEAPVVYQDGEHSLTLPSEELSNTAELDKNIDTVIVSERTEWNIEREVVNVYPDGTEVPTGEWVKTDTATTNEFLNSDEYTIETEANSR